MKSTRLATLCAALAISSQISFGQNASDNAANYSGGWTNGANGGTGFGAWAIVSTNGSTNGTEFFSGNFIGNPTNAGITAFGTTAFGFYANPNNTPAFVQADRSFNTPLTNNRTFSLRWAINYDSGAGGNKGFNLFTGGTNKIQILNINNGSSAAITLNGTDVGFGYGTTPMTWTFSQLGSNTIRVAANDRDGSGNFATNVTVDGPADTFRIYASAMQAGDESQPYFNSFAISNTLAGLDTNPPTIALASGVNKVTWVATNGTVNLSTNDVTAADGEGSVTVSFSPTNVVTTNNNFTTVTYTATDAAGYRASVSRVIAVGNDGNQWFYSIYPLTRTVSTVGSTTIGGELWVDGATAGAGGATGVQAWVGVNTNNNNPATWSEAAWTPAPYASEAGNNDRYEALISGSNRTVGANYYYATRFRLGTSGGNTNYFYGGIDSTGQGGRWGTTRADSNNVTYTNGNGTLTVVPGREVTFALDMRVQQFKNAFVSGEKVVVSGDFNFWGTDQELVLDSGSGLHKATIGIAGAVGATNNYKFRILGPTRTNDGLQYEFTADRPLVLESSNQAPPTAFFNNLEQSRKIAFSVDMSEQVTKGNFIPGTHTAAVRSSLDGFAGSLIMNRVGSSSTYALDYYLDGPVSGFPDTVQYKFFNSASNAPNSGYEGGSDRVLAKADINPTNLTTNTISATFVDATPAGATFTGWAGSGTATNSETVGKYAIGGATNISASSEKPVVAVDSNTLSLSAIVRTNDSKLTVVGEAGGSLTNWSTNGVSNTVAGSQVGVPEGHQRRVFSVDRTNSSTKLFLRLKATLLP